MSFFRIFVPLLVFVCLNPAGLNGQVTSIQRSLYGSPLIDGVPRHWFPRGGSYTAIIQGSGLLEVTGFVTSSPNVTGSVSSKTATEVTVQISSTSVKEAERHLASIRSVSFSLQTPTGLIPSGSVTLDIVSGPPPQVTNWKIVNSVRWVAAGIKTTVKYSADVLTAGNGQFDYFGGPEGGKITSWTSAGDPFHSTKSLTIDITAPIAFGFTAWGAGYGVVDGAGQGGNAQDAPLSPTKVLNLPVIQLQLVDPVTRTPANLLSGPFITTDTSRLGDQARGRIVKGVAADGVATLVVRIAGAPPGETLSMSVSPDGGLANNEDNPTFTSNIAVQADTSGVAFVQYRAPMDFAQPDGADDAAISRTSYLSFDSFANPGVTGKTEITIVRPPVQFVHGIWSTAKLDWEFFRPSGFNPPVYQAYFVDYADAQAAGVEQSSRVVLTSVKDNIETFKQGALTVDGSSIPVAAVQADLVGYSLGGLVSRALVMRPSYSSNETFGLGYVHKLITLDTPHLGSEFAARLLDGGFSNAACRSLFRAKVGPVAQNITDMAPNSELLRMLNTENPFRLHLPTAVIASSATFEQRIAADVAFRDWFVPKINVTLKNGPCHKLLPKGGYQEVFGGDSDLIVSIPSQLATGLGLAGPIPSMVFPGIHTASLPLFPKGPDVRQGNIVDKMRIGVAAPFASTDYVVRLLNSTVSTFRLIAP